MTRNTLVGMALAVLTAVAVLAGCATPDTQSSGHNQADVVFAEQMIPHHTQALDMAALVAGRTTSAKLIDLAKRIQSAQGPEIQDMTSWLKAWGAAPAASMPGMGGGSSMPGMTTGAGAPGMMSASDVAMLRAANGADFDTMWLRMMIQHHQGAIEMARTELSQGANADAKALAQKIIDGQQAEITEMNGLVGQS